MNDMRPLPSELAELANTLAIDLSADLDANHELAEKCLRMILSSGYEIQRASDLPPPGDGNLADRMPVLGKSCSLRDILSVWREFARDEAVGPAALYAEIGERILHFGEPLLAYDILKKGIGHWPEDLRLRQLRGLSLARSGAPHAAALNLRQLVDEGHKDEETLGLLARTCKDDWQTETDPARKRAALSEAYRLYRQGYDHAVARNSSDGALYAGINAATTAFLLDDIQTARALADAVTRHCQDKLESGPDYWAQATLGECALIRREVAAAAKHYYAALRIAGQNYAAIASTRRNAVLLMEHAGEELHALAEWFPIPRVAVFTGHLIDQPGRPLRFAHSQIEAVRRELGEILDNTNVGFGYSAAACGGDLLFLEALQNVNGESHIVLPLPRNAFVETSVAVESGRDWLSDFDRSMKYAANQVVVNDSSRIAKPEHFEYANQVMTGLAMIHAKTLGTELVPIAVWNEEPARYVGGAGSLVEVWNRLGMSPHIVNPLKLLTTSVPVANNSTDATPVGNEPEDSDEAEMSIRAMLFADAVGYSKLTEEEIPLFVTEFMGSISRSVRDSCVPIESGNTWGDAIYYVFRTVEDAGLTALRISEHIDSIDWKARGFKTQLKLRIGLHIGPVYRVIDPVTQQVNHTGAHVNRAARIEPIVPPGEVYASEAFAAVAAAARVKGFSCDYVGVTPMAKGYGEFPTYHVRRT